MALHFKQDIAFDWSYIIKLHNLYLERCALIEQTNIMHFFGLVMYNGDGINFSFKLSWFKILCANNWNKRFFNPKY